MVFAVPLLKLANDSIIWSTYTIVHLVVQLLLKAQYSIAKWQVWLTLVSSGKRTVNLGSQQLIQEKSNAPYLQNSMAT